MCVVYVCVVVCVCGLWSVCVFVVVYVCVVCVLLCVCVCCYGLNYLFLYLTVVGSNVSIFMCEKDATSHDLYIQRFLIAKLNLNYLFNLIFLSFFFLHFFFFV